jgi:hypothetical protein
METLNSPGQSSGIVRGEGASIRGAALGTCFFLGIAEWGEIAKNQEVFNLEDYTRKFGGYVSGYYLKQCVEQFFKEGGAKAIVARTAHYDAGVLQAAKSSLTAQGYNAGDDDRAKVDTLKFTATGEGDYGNKINLSTKKAETISDGELGIASHTFVTVDEVTGFEIGDIVDINDGTHYVRVIVTYIDSGTKRLYFTSVALAAAIATAATVKTASKHAVRTTLAASLETDATSIELTSVSGVEVGMVLTVVDKQSGSPYDVTLKVTGVSGKVIEFASVGTITTITAANSEVVSQEFNLRIYHGQDSVDKEYTYLSMSSEYEKNYVHNKVNDNSLYVVVADQLSAEDLIGDFPEVMDGDYLTGGADGLASLADTDFIGDETLKSGLYAFDAVPKQFAQFSSPDCRTASFQRALLTYSEQQKKMLFATLDIDFSKTPEQAKEYVLNTAMLNSRHGEINYPNVKFKNPLTGVVSNIPQSGASAGLKARIWTEVGKGPWIQAAGTENGVFRSLAGFESDYTQDVDYRDLLYEARINALYKYSPFGNLKYGIRTLEVNGEHPQIGELVTFLYCIHSIEQGTPWSVFANIDTSTFKRLGRTIKKFLRGVWLAGGLKGADESEAFIIDFDSVNDAGTEEKGEIWVKIGLATKKGGEFVYWVKIGLATKKGGEFVYYTFHKKAA